MSKNGTGRTQRLSREEFLQRSLDVLCREGESELRIQRLVRALGVTKGSFYWHFSSRNEFVLALAEHWRSWSTERVASELARVECGGLERLRRLQQIVIAEGLGRYDLVMRSWATHEPRVAKIVQQVDARRQEVVGGAFEALGFRGDDLLLRTRVFILCVSMWSIVRPGEEPQAASAELEAMLSLLAASE